MCRAGIVWGTLQTGMERQGLRKIYDISIFCIFNITVCSMLVSYISVKRVQEILMKSTCTAPILEHAHTTHTFTETLYFKLQGTLS
jgi:hypothetical protein